MLLKVLYKRNQNATFTDKKHNKTCFQQRRLCAYLQTFHHRDRCDRSRDGAHSLIKGILCLVSANYSPGSSIVNNLFVSLFGAWCGLEKTENSNTPPIKKNVTSHFCLTREKTHLSTLPKVSGVNLLMTETKIILFSFTGMLIETNV